MMRCAVLLLAFCSAASALAQNEDAAQIVFAKFKDRFAQGERDKLRPDLLEFRNRHFGTNAAVEAAGLLSQIASPLDKLDPTKIPALERFDWQPKELVAVLGEHRCRQGGAVTCVEVTPDGKTVISGGGHHVRFWDSVTMRQKAMVTHYRVNALSLSKDGKTLATAGGDARIRIWELSDEQPKLLHNIPCGTAILYAVALSPNAKMVAGAGVDALTRVFDVPPPKDDKEKITLGGNAKTVLALQFAPDGKTLVSAGQDETVRGWDVVTNPDQPKEIFTLTGHTKFATSLAYAPDGKTLVVGCGDGMVRLWNMATSKPSERTPAVGKGGYVYAVAHHPKLRQIAAATADGKVHFWDISVTPPRDRGTPAEGHINYASSIAYFPSGTTLTTGSADWTVRLWNAPLAGGKPTQRFDLKGHLSHVYTSLFTPDGLTLASGSYDRRVRLWSVGQAEARERSQLKGDDVYITSLSLAPDGKTLAAGGNSTTVRLYDAVAGRELRQLKGHPARVDGVAFAPDGMRLLAISGKEAILWNAAKAEAIQRMENLDSRFNSLAWSPDGKTVLTGHGDIEYREGQPVVVAPGLYKYLDIAARWWDADEAKELGAIKSYTRPVGPVAFLPDGKSALVTCPTTGESKLYRLDLSGSTLREAEPLIKSAGGYFRSITVSPDGKQVLTLGPDAGAVLWDAATGKRLNQWSPAETIGSAAFSSDSRHVAFTLATGPVYVLRLAGPN